MKLYATCGHTFNWPDENLHPEALTCSACGRRVAVYGVDLETATPAEAMNHGENRYRQLVLGQKPLDGYPTVTRVPSEGGGE